MAKKSIRQIAAELKCGLATVHADLQFVLAHWRRQALQDVGAVVSAELMRLEGLETEILDLAEKAKGSGDYAEAGRLFGQAVKLVEARCDLLGISGGKGVGRTTPGAEVTVKLVAGVVPSDLV